MFAAPRMVWSYRSEDTDSKGKIIRPNSLVNRLLTECHLSIHNYSLCIPYFYILIIVRIYVLFIDDGDGLDNLFSVVKCHFAQRELYIHPL